MKFDVRTGPKLPYASNLFLAARAYSDVSLMALSEKDYALLVSFPFCFSLTCFKDGYSFKYDTCKSSDFL